MKVTTTLNNGSKVIYDIILTYNENNNNYLVFTDNTLDREGRLRVYACLFDNDYNFVRELNNKNEWGIINNILLKL